MRQSSKFRLMTATYLAETLFSVRSVLHIVNRRDLETLSEVAAEASRYEQSQLLSLRSPDSPALSALSGHPILVRW